MEERDDIIMPHKRRSSRSGFGEVGDHGCDGVGAFAAETCEAREEGPDCCVGVFGF